MSSLSARLAAPSVFRTAGIDYAPVLTGVRASLEQNANGRQVLRLSSSRPINDPFIDVLLELNWSSGRLVREFTFLLDPPDEVAPRQQAVAPVVPRGVVDRNPAPRPRIESEADSSPVAEPPASRVARVAKPIPRQKPAREANDTGDSGKAPRDSSGRTHLVKRGETLARIAEETKPEGVSLDQMLVALYRDNPSAFDGGSIHRLRTGKILKIPEPESVAAVSPQEASRQVIAQAADFNAYRRKLAGAVAAAPAPGEDVAQQSASGKISARVEDKVPQPAESKDRLKVSRGEIPGGGKASAAGQSSNSKLASLEEDLIAKDKALKDTSARLAEVEKTVKELQKLVDMKNQNLADLQKQATTKPTTPATVALPVSPPPAPKPEPAPVAAKPAEATPPAAAKPAETAPPTTPAAAQATPPAVPAEAPKAEPAPAPVEAKPAPKPVVKPKPVAKPVPPPEPSFTDELLDNPTTLLAGGGVLALLLGYGGYKLRQKKKERESQSMAPLTTTAMTAGPSVFGPTGRTVDTSASAIHTDFSQSGLSSIDSDEGVDPVAEADVYMAYGRDAQAEEILVDALKTEPGRQAIRVKLLEIYLQRKDPLKFEMTAGELYAQSGGVGAEWEKAATLGRKLDPNNPLYGRGPAEEAAQRDVQDAQSSMLPNGPADALKDTWTMPGELAQLSGSGPDSLAPVAAPKPMPQPAPVMDHGLDFDLGDELDATTPVASAVSLTKPQAKPLTNQVPDLEFDLGSSDLGLSKTQPVSSDLDATLAFNGTQPLAKPELRPADDFDADLSATDTSGLPHPQSDWQTTHVVADMDLDLTTSLTGVSSPDVEMVDLEKTEIGTSLLDFELGATTPPTANRQEAPAPLDLSDITFDLGEPEDSSEETIRLPAAQPAAHDSFPDLDLDLGSAEPLPALNDEPPPTLEPLSADAADLDQGALDEAATKLELAQAYEEMGDKDGARELLQEVANEGSPDQKEKAKAALARLA